MKPIALIIIISFLASCNPSQENNSDFSNKNVAIEKNKGPIYGKWLVVSSTYLPFEHISYCDSLNLGSIFEFRTNETLDVYETENSESCTKDQTFKIIGSQLQIIEWDMVFDYEIQMLNSDTLKLKNDRIPSQLWSQPNLNDSIFTAVLKEFKENGIQITLKKIKTVANTK